MPLSNPQLPTHEEIESLSNEAKVAYAARCALRVFPLVGSEGHFDFWAGKEDTYLRAILAAMLVAVDNTSSVSASSVSASASASASAFAAKVAAAAANAADASAAAAANAADASAAGAADAAYAASANAAGFLSATRKDFESLNEYPANRPIPWRFFVRPLFEGTETTVGEWMTAEAEKAFEMVGCGDLLEIWTGFYEGKPRPKKFYADWVSDWYEEHQKTSGKGDPEDETVEGANSKGSEPEAYNRGYSTHSADGLADKDYLNRMALVHRLSRMLSSEEQETPLTIGLFGHWGAGKSSMMKLLQEELAPPGREGKKNLIRFLFSWFNCLVKSGREGKKKPISFLFSWFNCWEYEHTDNIQAGLAQEVVNGLLGDGQFSKNERKYTKGIGFIHKTFVRIGFLWEEKRGETLSLLIKTIFTLALIAVGGGAGKMFSMDVPYLEGGAVGAAVLLSWYLLKQGKFLWDHPLKTELATFFKLPSYRQELGQIPNIRKQLESLCKVRLYKVRLWKEKKVVRRLVVFVDDMDRCKTDTISQAFDAIRLIVDIKEVIVIVGIDERVAFKAMGRAYQNYADPGRGRSKDDVARDYLGKIIQIPIRLNVPNPEDLKNYIDKQLFPEKQRQKDQDVKAMNMPGLEPRKNGSLGNKKKARSEPVETDLEQTSGVKGDGIVDSEKPGTSPNNNDSFEEKQDEMKETNLEVEAFCVMSVLFDFANPRQLLRLRNSYRMLKGIVPDEKVNFVLDYSLLFMLFWLEFRLEKSSTDIKKWIDEQNLKIEDDANWVITRFKESFLPAILSPKKGTREAGFFFEDKNLKELESITRTCVLPYPRKEIPRTQS